MIAYYYPVENARQLIWIFAGWGTDHRLYLHRPLPGLSPQQQQDASLLLLYAYGDAPILWKQADTECVIEDWQALLCRPEIMAYTRHCLWAWSMGVWAAEQYALPRLAYALAVNGTARPVDDLYGIPSAIFRGTLEGLSDRNVEKFRRRMCGTKAAMHDFMMREPLRNLESLRSELQYIGDRVATEGAEASPYPKAWDAARISDEDAIFPTAHTMRYWTERNVYVDRVYGGHYPFTTE